ncbi:E3 ubiquitin-protein ligase TRIM21-like [Rhinoraja longicauda]
MASMAQSECWTEDVVCPICLDLFTHPVSLECGHNFCRSCITQSWDREGRNSCPECREEFADRSLRMNRALVSITEKARTLSPKTESKQSKLHCEEHQEELKLFCETDKQLICLICRDAREHREHLFMPIKEAVEIFKEKIKTSLETLTKNKSAMEEMENYTRNSELHKRNLRRYSFSLQSSKTQAQGRKVSVGMQRRVELEVSVSGIILRHGTGSETWLTIISPLTPPLHCDSNVGLVGVQARHLQLREAAERTMNVSVQPTGGSIASFIRQRALVCADQ